MNNNLPQCGLWKLHLEECLHSQGTRDKLKKGVKR